MLGYLPLRTLFIHPIPYFISCHLCQTGKESESKSDDEEEILEEGETPDVQDSDEEEEREENDEPLGF